MIDPKILDEFTAKISAFIAASPAKDLEKNIRAMLGVLFANLNLVTQEQFDVQAELLKRTQERLKALEDRIEALERAGKTS